jgi:hypothetical protein
VGSALGWTVATAVAIAALAAPVLAQTERVGARQIFERGRDDPARGRTLDVTVDVTSAYDENLPESALGGLPVSAFQLNGVYTTLAPQLEFRTGGGRGGMNLSAGSNLRNYADLHQVLVMNHFAGGGFIARLTPHTTVSYTLGVAYAPTYLNGLFSVGAAPAGTIAPPNPNSIVDAQHSYDYATTATLTQQITKRAVLSFSPSFRYNDFIGHDLAYPDFRSSNAGGQLLYFFGRNVRLRFGYKFQQSQSLGLAQTTEHDLDIGFDYDVHLSRTRMTRFAFSLGPVQATGLVTSDAAEAALRRQYRLTSDASVNHDMGRTWSAGGTYHRGLGFIEGLPTPVYTSAFGTKIAGNLSRRVDVSLSASYSSGESALTGAPSPFETYTGNARMRFALGRRWATYTEYVFYYYKFGLGFELPAGVPSGLRRNGLRVGLTAWIPVRH